MLSAVGHVVVSVVFAVNAVGSMQTGGEVQDHVSNIVMLHITFDFANLKSYCTPLLTFRKLHPQHVD